MNIIEVEATGREIPVLCDGLIIDFEEFKIISCDVEPEKGRLIYDINPAALELIGPDIKISTKSRETQIGTLRLIAEQELDLMRERGVTVSVHRRVTCHRRDLPCDPLKAPPGGCAGCHELTRK